MKKKNILTIFISLLINFISYSQTTLSAGDIAITSFNSDGNDEFYFTKRHCN